MLVGRFGNTSGRPYVEGMLVIPDLNIMAPVSFLIDTGSDCCVLMPADAARIKVDYTKLHMEIESTGIGGTCMDFLTPAAILFSDEQERILYGHNIALRISKQPEDIDKKDEPEKIPSLIGRDIIKNWRIDYNPRADSLIAQVLWSDREEPL